MPSAFDARLQKAVSSSSGSPTKPSSETATNYDRSPTSQYPASPTMSHLEPPMDLSSPSNGSTGKYSTSTSMPSLSSDHQRGLSAPSPNTQQRSPSPSGGSIFGRRRRGSSSGTDLVPAAASKPHKQTKIKPGGGIAAALASSSVHLVNPASGILTQAPPGPQRTSNGFSLSRSNSRNRPRAETGVSVKSDQSSAMDGSSRSTNGDQYLSLPTSSEPYQHLTNLRSSATTPTLRPISTTPTIAQGGSTPVIAIEPYTPVDSSYSLASGGERTPVFYDNKPKYSRAALGLDGDDDSEGATKVFNDRSSSRSGRSATYDSHDDNDDSHSFTEEDDLGSEDEEDEDDEDEEFDLDMLPVTGFAVASNKRQEDFHLLFEGVPEDDYLIEDYGCALQRDILLQGRLYVSENHCCFHANIFGWVTNLVIPFSDILRIDKKMTAYVIPNAIQVTTHDAKHTFASFLSRDATYDVMQNPWRLSIPRTPSNENETEDPFNRSMSPSSTDNDTNGVRFTASSPSAGPQLGRRMTVAQVAALQRRVSVVRKPTQCACGKKGEHYTETALSCVFPSSPEKIYNLMFTSGFMKEFMTGDQKLTDIQTSDWAPTTSGTNRLARNMSYIKPLAGGFGPKQTKCEINDEAAHVDFDDYVSMLTTTRNPDVPSGGVFAVKTRTCLMWAGNNSCKVVVTTQVDWTGRSFIKGIIDSSALAGQKAYHEALEKSMRNYITAHPSEFVGEAGPAADEADAEAAAAAAAASIPTTPSGEPSYTHQLNKEDQVAAERRAQDEAVFQYGLDSFQRGLKQLLKGIIAMVTSVFELLSDLPFPRGIKNIVVMVLIIGLVWSNISGYYGRLDLEKRLEAGGLDNKTKYSSLKSQKRLPPPIPVRRSSKSSSSQTTNLEATAEESPDSVAEAVRSFLQEFMLHQHVGEGTRGGDWTQEVILISKSLDGLEERITKLRDFARELEASALRTGGAAITGHAVVNNGGAEESIVREEL